MEIYDARLELAGWSEAVTFDVGSGSYAFTLKGVAEADGGA